ncbi:MAG TPA: ABC transporter permease [Thermoguttaceae bacterium]|nr:ABC transporter permease [Thermoguttaceae bacterium]
MYQLLLCWRYLRTRYIALASIISVTLGVATMIVVNSVMSGFTTEMRDRIHNILSDVVLDSRSLLDGFPDAEAHMERIREVAGESIEAMTPMVVVPAMVSMPVGGQTLNWQVQVIGVDPAAMSQVAGSCEYLQHPENRKELSFLLRDGKYDTRDHQAGPDAPERPEMAYAGWEYRRQLARVRALPEQLARSEDQYAEAAPLHPGSPQDDGTAAASDPFSRARGGETGQIDLATEQYPGLVMGIALASRRENVGNNEYEDRFLVLPGDDVTLTYPTAATPPKFVSAKFTIVDFWESKMSEYDSSFVFVPLRKLQEDRGLYDYVGGRKRYFVSSIQIKLKPGVDGAEIRDKLRAAFPSQLYTVSTWRDKQGPLLAAVRMEIAILNVLLFLIIAVAGFGILAIFLMIVAEKTRDIGILKSLGASGWGIQGIFVSYGLSLGLVGSGVGMVLGLLFVHYINQIADFLGWLTGQPLFDPEIYYFYEIPAIVEAWTVGWIVAGAVAIALLASILPAFRAARLHPVEALRYE